MKKKELQFELKDIWHPIFAYQTNDTYVNASKVIMPPNSGIVLRKGN
jgi:hypothetical protein